eukprot:681351-Prorocentrum_minimum.AAC.3
MLHSASTLDRHFPPAPPQHQVTCLVGLTIGHSNARLLTIGHSNARRLVELVPRYIDAVGRMSLSGAAKAKAVKSRAKAEEERFKLTLQQRQLELARKKQEEKLAEREALGPK